MLPSKITLNLYVEKADGMQGAPNIIRTRSKRDKAGSVVTVKAVGSGEHLTYSIGYPGQGGHIK